MSKNTQQEMEENIKNILMSRHAFDVADCTKELSKAFATELTRKKEELRENIKKLEWSKTECDCFGKEECECWRREDGYDIAKDDILTLLK